MQPSPQVGAVVPLVGVQFRQLPAPGSTAGAEGRDAPDKRLQAQAVVHVRAGDTPEAAAARCGHRSGEFSIPVFRSRSDSVPPVAPLPVGRGGAGSKHHLVTDGHGAPLADILTGGNSTDVTQLLPLLDAFSPVRGRSGRPRRKPE